MMENLEEKSVVDLKGWYAVYPGIDKIDSGPKKPVAYCKFESHAEEMIRRWPGTGYYEQVRK
jgi:hypothetical protein